MSKPELTKLEYFSLKIFELMLTKMQGKIDNDYWIENAQSDAVFQAASLLREIAKEEAKHATKG